MDESIVLDKIIDKKLTQRLQRLWIGDHAALKAVKIFVLGDTGAGKSSTINSILGESQASTVGALTSNATDAVIPISRCIKNFTLTLVDTPGLQDKDSFSYSSIRKIERYFQSFAVDVVLFCRRMDIYHDEPNEKETISILTSYMGRDIWRRAVLVLTRAGYSPTGSDNENFVLKKVESFQRSVRQESGSLVPLVSFVENCRARMRLDGQMVLPDGTVWIENFLESTFKLIDIDPIPYRWNPERKRRLSLDHSWLIHWLPLLSTVIVHLSFKFCLRIIAVEDNLTGDSEGPFNKARIAQNRASAAEVCIRDKLCLVKKNRF